MDPVTTLGVAAAIVQLTSFAGNVVRSAVDPSVQPRADVALQIKTTHEIYKSTESLSKHNEKVLEMSQEMDTLSAALQSRMQATRGPTPDLDISTAAVLRTAATCQQRADRLQTALHGLKPNETRHRILKLLSSSAKSILKKSKIEDLARDLKDSQRLLDSAVLTSILESISVADDRQRQAMNTFDFRILGQVSDSRPVEQAVQNLQAQLGDAKLASAEEHKQTREFIATQQEELFKSEKYQRWLHLVLDSLSFPSMNAREEVVSDAHPGTYAWIFGKTRSDGHYRHPERESFTDWLQYEGDIFWISGKPGSGKSTLMRWIAEDRANDVRANLTREMSTLVDPIILRYFFWRNGHPDQRSLNGCLKSLLKQLLIRQNDLAMCVDGFREGDTPPWHSTRLFKNLSEALIRALRLSPICIFVDGLDECEEVDQDSLLQTIGRFSRIRGIKICVSSRAENRFNDAFHGKPTLRLQDLTYQDIRKMVRGRLQGPCFPGYEYAEYVQFCERARDRIVAKAEGVFLWAHIAVRNVLNKLANGTELKALLQYVEDMKDTLDELFAQILRERAQESRQTARWLQMLWLPSRLCHHTHRDEHTPLSLWMLLLLESNIDQIEELRSLKNHEEPEMSYGHYKKIYENLERRSNLLGKQINAQCGGLVDICAPSREFYHGQSAYVHKPAHVEHIRGIGTLCRYLNCTGIEWIHRTAADFVTHSKFSRAIFKIARYSAGDAAFDVFLTNLRTLEIDMNMFATDTYFGFKSERYSLLREEGFRDYLLTTLACSLHRAIDAQPDAPIDNAFRMSQAVVDALLESFKSHRPRYDFDGRREVRRISQEHKQSIMDQLQMQWFDKLMHHGWLSVVLQHFQSTPKSERVGRATNYLIYGFRNAPYEIRSELKNAFLRLEPEVCSTVAGQAPWSLNIEPGCNSRAEKGMTKLFKASDTKFESFQWNGDGLVQPGDMPNFWSMQMMQFLDISLSSASVFPSGEILQVLEAFQRQSVAMESLVRVSLSIDSYHIALDISFSKILALLDLKLELNGIKPKFKTFTAAESRNETFAVRALRKWCAVCYRGLRWHAVRHQHAHDLSVEIEAMMSYAMNLEHVPDTSNMSQDAGLEMGTSFLYSKKRADVIALLHATQLPESAGFCMCRRSFEPREVALRRRDVRDLIPRQIFVDPGRPGRSRSIRSTKISGRNLKFFGPSRQEKLVRRYSSIECERRPHFREALTLREPWTEGFIKWTFDSMLYGSLREFDAYETIPYRPPVSDQLCSRTRNYLTERRRFVHDWPDLLFWRCERGWAIAGRSPFKSIV